MTSNRPGLSFEKAVAQVQSRFDAAAQVCHNEILVDRLGHPRQFDVVIRGRFAGQALLGVIECKDLKRKVGTPEVDGFVTKSRDVNANIRVLISRRGFTKRALEKCADYGIQPLSLLGHDTEKLKTFLGTRWEAELIRWKRMSVTLRYPEASEDRTSFSAPLLTIRGKKVLDWFANYILEHEHEITGFGWVVGIGVEFSKPQIVNLGNGKEKLCRAIEFHAERTCERFERIVGVSGIGFYDWNTKTACFPPNTTISTEDVSMDFSTWTPVAEGAKPLPGFMNVRILTREVQFERIADAIELDTL